MNIKLEKFNPLTPTALVREKIFIDMTNPIRELTGSSPLTFKTVSEELIDWRINGAAGGVGKLGKNYLRQVEGTIPDGTYGKKVSAVYSDSTSRTGTFNSGSATNISFRFNANDSSISPQDIGRFIISDGENETELDILSGYFSELLIDEDGGYALTVQCGDDGTGRIVIYYSGDLPALGKWCYSPKFDITPNTDYTFERIGGIENVKIQYITSTDIGNVNMSWSAPLNSIPGNEAADKNIEQWTTMSSSRRYWQTSTVFQPIDSHPALYNYCSYFADLPAGSYKVIAEGIGNGWGYTRMQNQDLTYDQTPYMALVAEDNTQIIPRRAIFSDTSSQFHHEEYSFTLAAPTKVGLYFKAINPWNVASNNYSRFMIVDDDVEAEPFVIDTPGGTITGITCWEPYRVTLPVIIMNHDESQFRKVEFDLGTSPLGVNDTIDFATTNIPLPTFIGENTIMVDSTVPPSEIYIKYRRFEEE